MLTPSESGSPNDDGLARAIARSSRGEADGLAKEVREAVKVSSGRERSGDRLRSGD
jgi:hypothetical protein